MTTQAPGPQGLPLLGSLLDLRRDPLSLFTRVMQDYGGVVQMRMGPQRIHLVTAPDGVRHILQDNNKNYTKNTRGYDIMRTVLGQGLLTSDGSFWLRQRRIAQPAFHKRHLHTFSALMVQAADAMLDRWQPDKPLDVSAELMALTLRVVVQTLFGTDQEPPVADVSHALEVVLRTLNRRTVGLWIPDRWPNPENLKLRAAVRTLDAVVLGYIHAHRADPHLADRPDLLSMLLRAKDEDTGESMTDAQLRDEALTLFLAGHETTASNLSWTLALLSQHPDVARRLYDEVFAVLGDAPPTVEDLPKLTYTSQVIDESLRLYPPAWILARRAIADDTIDGIHIPASAYVLISPYASHRNPSIWPNPEGFDPDRFAPGADKLRPRFSYFPFSGGPRICIGQSFALLEAKLILARIVQRFALHLIPGYPISPEPLITLRVRNGLWMTPSPRALSQ
jgi:cytochrome P450